MMSARERMARHARDEYISMLMLMPPCRYGDVYAVRRYLYRMLIYACAY